MVVLMVMKLMLMAKGKGRKKGAKLKEVGRIAYLKAVAAVDHDPLVPWVPVAAWTVTAVTASGPTLHHQSRRHPWDPIPVIVVIVVEAGTEVVMGEVRANEEDIRGKEVAVVNKAVVEGVTAPTIAALVAAVEEVGIAETVIHPHLVLPLHLILHVLLLVRTV